MGCVLDMTPVEIEVLFDHYILHEVPIYESSAHKSAVLELLNLKLIQHNEDCSKNELTGRGQAHVFQLLNLPLPVEAWVGADGNPITGRDNQ